MAHIKEKEGTGGIDWNLFYGSDANDRAKWGPKLWQLLHDSMDNIPCASCREAGQIMISGLHDMVNIHRGVGVMNEKFWKDFLSMVDDAKKHNPHQVHFEHERKENSTHFDPHSFRTIERGNDRIVIGCQAGHFHGGSCDIGTRVQAVLHKVH